MLHTDRFRGIDYVRRWLFALWAFGLWLLPSGSARALDPARSISQYVQTVWDTSQGLPDQAVQALLQSRDGYLWAGTHGGLARFDGVRFVVFSIRNSGLRHDYVRALAEDAAGRVWIGTAAGGLHWLQDGVIHPFAGLPELTIYDLQADPDGSVWVASSAGLHRVLGSRLEQSWRVVHGLGADAVLSLWREADGRLLVGTARGLNTLADGRLSPVWPAAGRSEVRAILRRHDGSLWLGCFEALLVIRGTELQTRYPQSWESSQIHDLLEDSNRNLWIASYGQGLQRWHEGQFETYGTSLGFIDRRIWKLLEDREGSLWAGTRQGLVRLRDGPVVSWTSHEGLPDDHVRAVHEAPDGAIWLAHLAGVSRLADGHFQHFGTAQGLPGQVYRSFVRDQDGALWLGGEAGLSRLEDGQVRSYDRRDGLPNNTVKILLADRDGRIWIGIKGGLAWIRDGRIESPPWLAPLLDASIEALEQDRQGSIWIGTLEHGFWRIREGVLESIALGTESRIGVRSILEDHEGVLWVGSTASGLYVLDRADRHGSANGQLRQLGVRDGLLAEGIWSILEDGQDRLWFSSDRGLFRISRASLLGRMRGRAAQVEVDVWLTEADGMKSREANGGGRPAGLIASDGRLWYPTARGAVVVDPAALESAPARLNTRIEALQLGDQSVPVPPEGGWQREERSLELVYTALYLANAEALQFRYRLRGQDADWVNAGKRRAAFYTNLSPGRYVFEVQARLVGQPWAALPGETASVDLEILMHWHERSWVRVLAGLSVAWILALLVWQRLQRQRGIAAELKLLVEQRTTELKSANAELARLAATDGLTGMATSRVFWQVLAEQLVNVQASAPLALVLIDVDDFKAYNDTYGHVQGDACLRHIAAVLQALTVGSEALVARYGGEEFALLLPASSALSAQAVAELARQRVEDLALPAGVGARHRMVTISLGLALAADSRITPQELAEAADRQLYAAKHAGRNRVRVETEAMNQERS